MFEFLKKLFGFDKETMKDARVQIEQAPYKVEPPIVQEEVKPFNEEPPPAPVVKPAKEKKPRGPKKPQGQKSAPKPTAKPTAPKQRGRKPKAN